MTASRSTMLAMMTASSMVRPFAAIALPDLGRELGPELGEQPLDDLAWRRVRAADLVFERLGRDVPLERTARGQVVQKVELVQEIGRRRLEDGGKFLEVHRHLAAAKCGDHLLEPQPSTRVTLSSGRRHSLQRRDDLGRTQPRRQVVGAEIRASPPGPL